MGHGSCGTILLVHVALLVLGPWTMVRVSESGRGVAGKSPKRDRADTLHQTDKLRRRMPNSQSGTKAPVNYGHRLLAPRTGHSLTQGARFFPHTTPEKGVPTRNDGFSILPTSSSFL